MTTNTDSDPNTKYGCDPQAEEQQTHPGSTQELAQRIDHGESSYKGSGKLTGRKAIITGGDSGIGRAVAIAFARERANVLIPYLDEHEDAEDTAKYVRVAGARVVLVSGDIRQE